MDVKEDFQNGDASSDDEESMDEISEINNQSESTISEQNSEQSTVISRSYQIEMFELAKERDLVVCLPTGSGKTWIALLLTKYYLPTCIEKGKVVVFLANTVALVVQQFQYFKAHIPSTSQGFVSHFIGAMNVDSWSTEYWNEQVKPAKVIVFSSQIFLDVIKRGIMKFSDVVLIVFDECHHADLSHPMNIILDRLKERKMISGNNDIPRILGLTATIIKGIPKGGTMFNNEIERIERTFGARAVTHSDYESVLRHSTRAKSTFVYYVGFYKSNLGDFLAVGRAELMALKLPSNDDDSVKLVMETHQIPYDQCWSNSKSLTKKLANQLQDVEDIYVTLGPYCATVAAAILIVATELKIKIAKTQEVKLVYQLFKTKLVHFQHVYGKFTVDANDFSPKLKSLVEELSKWARTGNRDLCGIIFMEKKLDCQVLKWFCDDLAMVMPEMGFIRSRFITAVDRDHGVISNQTRITFALQQKYLNEFRNGDANLVFSTSVLEEGLDVPSCNFVMRFDAIQSFRSYAQSMGRARNPDSQFVIFINQERSKESLTSLASFEIFSRSIADALQKNALHLGDGDEVESIQRVSEIEPFRPNGLDGALLTSHDAISLVNRYCVAIANRSRGMVDSPGPISWYSYTDNGYVGNIVMPRNSLIKQKIQGPVMPSKDGAKRTVHFEACKVLYEMGGLDSLFRPVRPCVDDAVLRFFDYNNASVEPKENAYAACMNWFRKSIPGVFKNVGGDCWFIYEVQIQLLHPRELKKEKIFDYSKASMKTGIMSRASLTTMPPFKLESGLGSLCIQLVRVHTCVTPTTDDALISIIRKYQDILFRKIIGLNLNCTEEKSPDEHYMYIIPLRQYRDSYYIDSDTMIAVTSFYQNNTSVTYETRIEESERKSAEFKRSIETKDYSDTVIIPWYKPLERKKTFEENFMCVLEVQKHLSPQSLMPNSNITYAEYHRSKYNVRVMINDQPLLLCYRLGNTLDYLKVKCGSKIKNKSKADSSVNSYIPEFLRIFPMPASIFSQARLLPSIIHKIHRFLTAMEIGYSISGNEIIPQIPTYKYWEYFTYDEVVDYGEDKKINNSSTPVNGTIHNDTNDDGDTHGSRPILDLRIIHPFKVTMEDIEMKASEFWKEDNALGGLLTNHFETDTSYRSQCLPLKRQTILEPTIDVTRTPPVYEILSGITLLGANDRIDLERLEIMGDSFLKYATTLFLYGQFMDYDQGRLTQLRGNLVSNKHLRHLGRFKGLEEVLAGSFFVLPELTFLPPTFNVKEKCASAVFKTNKTLQAFDDLSNKEIDSMSEEELLQHARSSVQSMSTKRSILGYGKLRMKDVADSVEALIGAYYVTGGQIGALHLMRWLNLGGPDSEGNFLHYGNWIIPKQVLLHVERHDVKEFIPCLEVLERQLNYKFINPWLALEAFTHPNYICNEVTDNYERLEFLGDAVLDFLITNHVYKFARSPGEVTDIRSALVNNITFAALAIRNNLDKYLLLLSEPTQQLIDRYRRVQEETNHLVQGQFELLTECEAPTARNIDVPKVLGDIFESLCGAVFTDSGYNLDVTWSVFYRLMAQEIAQFCKSCPKSPVRVIMEMGHKFTQIASDDPSLVLYSITINKQEFRGYGTCKKSGKEAAAKLALRRLTNSTQ